MPKIVSAHVDFEFSRRDNTYPTILEIRWYKLDTFMRIQKKQSGIKESL